MKRKFALVLIQVFLFGCSSDGADSPSPATGHHAEMTELVPLTIGAQWTYLARSQSRQTPDTIVIRNEGTATLGVQRRVVAEGSLINTRVLLDFMPADIWVAGYPPSPSGVDTLVFYWSPLDSVPAATFLLPPQAPNSWTCDECNLLRLPARVLTSVVSLEAFSAPAGDFEDVLQVRSRCAVIPLSASDFNIGGEGPSWPDLEAEFWIKPDVGLIALHVTLLWEEKLPPQRDQNEVFEFELLEFSTGRR